MNELDAHYFSGTSPDYVVIVAGIHTSEQGGVEVAHWIRTKLAARSQPTRLGAVVIPEVFPDRGLQARATEFTVGPGTWNASKADDFREARDGRKPNRHFPPPGKPLAFLDKGNLKGLDGKEIQDKAKKPIPQLTEIRNLIRIIEAVRPVRIVSIHGKHRRTKANLTKAAADGIITMTDKEIEDWKGDPVKGVNFTGIYVDPRYSVCHTTGFDLEDCKFDPAKDPAFPNTTKKDVSKQFDSAISADGRLDDALALQIAKAVKDGTLVAGNHLGDPPEVVHYAKESGTPNAFSLGDWGPVEVTTVPSGASGIRPGAPVFTIEVDEDHESWAFLDGIQYMDESGQPIPQPKRPAPKATPAKFDKKRSAQLQDYAQAIIAACLA